MGALGWLCWSARATRGRPAWIKPAGDARTCANPHLGVLGHLSNPIANLVLSLAGAKGHTENQKLEMGPPSSSGSAPALFQRDVSPEGSPYNRAKELEKLPVPHLFGHHSL